MSVRRAIAGLGLLAFVAVASAAPPQDRSEVPGRMVAVGLTELFQSNPSGAFEESTASPFEPPGKPPGRPPDPPGQNDPPNPPGKPPDRPPESPPGQSKQG